MAAHTEVYRDTTGQWRWKTRAANNRVVATSAESYRNRWWARHQARKQGVPVVTVKP